MARAKPPSVRALVARVAELETALEHALQVAAAERARAEHFEGAYRASIRTALGMFTPPLRRPHPPIPMRSCNHCGTRFQPRRKDSRFCGPRCQVNAWRRRHGRRKQDAPSGPQDVQEARTAEDCVGRRPERVLTRSSGITDAVTAISRSSTPSAFPLQRLFGKAKPGTESLCRLDCSSIWRQRRLHRIRH